MEGGALHPHPYGRQSADSAYSVSPRTAVSTARLTQTDGPDGDRSGKQRRLTYLGPAGVSQSPVGRRLGQRLLLRRRQPAKQFTKPLAVVWKNVRRTTPSTTRDPEARVTALCLSGGTIYAAGHSGNSAAVWKTGPALP